MKNCILFASYIPNESDIWVGKQFLDYFKDNFQEYDIYVGVNPSHEKWLNLLEEYKTFLTLDYEVTPTDLVVNSDASSFQTSLKLLKNSNKKYNTVWYTHTKGVTSHCHDFRQSLFNAFFSKKTQIESLFKNETDLGAYYPFTGISLSSTYMDQALEKVINTPTKGRVGSLCSLYTFYVHNGEAVDFFLKNHIKEFFDKKLEPPYQDRYFFERDFSMLPLKLGYRVHKDSDLN